MKRRFYFPGLIVLLFVGLHMTFAQTTTVTLDFTADPEWDGSGNTGNVIPNSNDYGYRNIEGVTGVKEGDYGCIGGIFCRTMAYSFYADTELNGTLNRTMTLKIAGSMKLENRSSGAIDGAFGIGYFDATNPHWNIFLGLQIKEPKSPADPFRGVVGLNIDDLNTITGVIPIVQLQKVDFDLTFTGSADGSGAITGTLAGQNVNLILPAGTTEFKSFGLLVGGMSFDRNERTRNCYFDDVTYTKVAASSVDKQTFDMINIYPNITTDRVNFNNLPDNSRIELVDMVGRTILVKNASELNGGLSLQSYTNGLYMIRVMQGHENVKSVKVLKK
jgi:hypothetical protein